MLLSGFGRFTSVRSELQLVHRALGAISVVARVAKLLRLDELSVGSGMAVEVPDFHDAPLVCYAFEAAAQPKFKADSCALTPTAASRPSFVESNQRLKRQGGETKALEKTSVRCKPEVTGFRLRRPSLPRRKTRHQFVTKTGPFSGIFQLVRNGKARQAKGFSFLTAQLTRWRSTVRARSGLPNVFNVYKVLFAVTVSVESSSQPFPNFRFDQVFSFFGP
jgi:hypothetical protein